MSARKAMGSIPAGSFRIDASTSNIPASASSPLEVTSATGYDVCGLEIANGTAADVTVYLGPDTNLDVLTISPGLTSGVVVQQRQPCIISQGARIAVRASANAAISSGRLIINLWA